MKDFYNSVINKIMEYAQTMEFGRPSLLGEELGLTAEECQ